jgi:hypothetical protein
MSTNDFGFFFEDDQSQTISKAETSRETAVVAANKLYERINTLLVKLEENPDKPTINWPDRVNHIAKFRKELQSILNAA